MIELKRKYMADAQKRFRKNKKVEKDHFSKRNIYLEAVLPVLKRKIDTLKDECCALQQNLEEKTALKSSSNLDLNDNILMRQQVAFYRSYRENLSHFLQLINQKNCSQISQFVVQTNFNRILRKAAQIKAKRLNLAKTLSTSFITANSGKVTFEVSQSTNIMEGKRMSKLTKIRIRDIPLQKQTLLKTIMLLGDDKNFLKRLAGLCHQGESSYLSKWVSNQKRVVQVADVRVDSGHCEREPPVYFVYGTNEAFCEENEQVAVILSILSDYNKNVDDLWINDPTYLEVFNIENGKDETHCNVDFFFYFEDSPRCQKYDFNDRDALRYKIIANLASIHLEADSLKLLLNQCIMMQERTV